MPEPVRILLVEDNPGDAGLIRELLPESGPVAFSIEVVPRLSAALERIQAGNLDIILLDLGLPDSRDIHTFFRIQNEAPDLPIVVISGNNDDAIALESVRRGAQDYLVKGRISQDLLMRSIRYAVERKKAQTAQRASEERYRAIAENQPVAVCRWLPDTTLTYANTYYIDNIAGNADLTGKRWLDFVPESNRAGTQAFYRSIVERPRMVTYEHSITSTNKGIRWFSWIDVPIFDNHGNLLEFQSVGTDITEKKSAEDAVRKSEEAMKKAQRVAQVGSWTWNIPDNRLEWSDEMFRIFGIDKDAFSGDLSEVIAGAVHPDDRAAVERSNDSVTRQKTPIPMEYRVIRPDGTVRTVWAEAGELILDDNGNPKSLSGIVQDITERKRTEETLLIQSAAMDNAANAIVITDVQGTVIYANPAHEKLTGYFSHEAVGKNPRDLVKSGVQDAGFYRKMWNEILAGRVWHGEMKNRRKDGSLYDEEMTIAPVTGPDGDIRHFVAIKQDITERKKTQARLVELHDGLERMVAERTADLEKANRELESFSYTVSHDLRAPLRHINGFLEMFRREAVGSLSGKALHYMEVIDDATRHMGQLIDDLLAFSRMGRTDIALRDVQMEMLLNEVLKEFADDIERRGITVTRSPLPSVAGDTAMLRLVLANLVSNAVKFTQMTAMPSIEIGSDSKDGEHLFYVRDNGAGFDMRYAGKLFGVFQRLHAEKDYKGTGIGLATVQMIVQRHGGRVWAEGETGKGACFYFTLPAPQPPGGVTPPNPPEGG